MKIIRTIAEMQEQSLIWKREGLRVGVVPTMGCLHEGHLSLVDQIKEYADRVIVTIFVNPTQFGPNEDLDAYPRTFEADRKACEARGASAIFFPEVSEMYDDAASTWVTEDALSLGLCAGSRPTHFRGVTTVVTKLYNATLPDVAIFGEKDFQQLAVLRRMTKDLNFPIKVLGGAIVREGNGLAMSSRNKYLSDEERDNAAVLNQSLKVVEERLQAESVDAEDLIAFVSEAIEAANGKVDYVEIRSAETLENLEGTIGAGSNARMILAAYFGKARLLDNWQIAAP